MRLQPQDDLEDEERERLARQLGAELRELDIDSLTALGDRRAPAGAKGDPFTWGEWLITLSAGGGVFTTILATLLGWLGRNRAGHTVKVTIDGDTLELTGATSEEQQRMVEAFVQRHSGT
ncbi:effector-associated constant component EACC1 [Pseudonocardia sp. TRM90224]|uniref:effector-associated constant component EACC1 n=1 Tax=Pseudonocardia sp. TRM90224 TaxID=2812678 RepID=UPI001E3B13A4|nr:hypothetical protein [Pseudonocardia sp. TRM90224]